MANVIRLNFERRSTSVNLADIAYLTYTESDKWSTMQIYLTFASGVEKIQFTANNEQMHELNVLYLDLYTKWRNKVDEEKEFESQLLGSGVY